jgi:glutaminase
MYTDFFESIEKIYHKLKNTTGGKNADYIKELEKVNPKLYAISIYTVDGQQFSIGDYDHEFALESSSKVFTLALALKKYGIKTVEKKIGQVGSDAKFNSVCAIVDAPTHTMNSFDNGGAMATTSLLYNPNQKQYVKTIVDNMNEFAGRKLYVNDSIYKSEMNGIAHNFSIAYLLRSYGRFYSDDIPGVVKAYTKQCSVMVTSKDAALMACTIANQGVNPKTKKHVISKENAKYIINHMALVGLYDETKIWMGEVGLPMKSGVSGILIASIPGVMGISIISPPLNKYGNSVKGLKTAKEIAKIITSILHKKL